MLTSVKLKSNNLHLLMWLFTKLLDAVTEFVPRDTNFQGIFRILICEVILTITVPSG